MGKPTVDLTGQRFRKLRVISRAAPVRGHTAWNCICDCGRSCVRLAYKLKNGVAVSCGCLVGGATHGHTRGQRHSIGRSPTFTSWQSMISRCTQPSNPAFAYYRKLGVTVCERWRSFENFLADMGERPSLSHSIDRYPNNRGNYEPKNCRWATKREQANNRVTNNVFVFRGTALTLTELARATGLPYELLRHRLVRAGWSVEEAITSEKRQGRRRRD